MTMVAMVDEKTVTLREAADIACKDKRTIQRWIADKSIGATTILDISGQQQTRVSLADLHRKLGAGLPEVRQPTPPNGGWEDGMPRDNADDIIEQPSNVAVSTSAMQMQAFAAVIGKSISEGVTPLVGELHNAHAEHTTTLERAVRAETRYDSVSRQNEQAERRIRNLENVVRQKSRQERRPSFVARLMASLTH